MRVQVVAVGRPSKLLAPAIAEFEKRAGRYWKLDTTDVAPERATKNRPVADVVSGEAEKLIAAAGQDLERVVLTRTGKRWSSRALARYLQKLAVRGGPGAAFLIGGAYGLDDELVRTARHRISLSGMTLPHELARLVLAEQLYRAGTIARGEPYHKG